MNMKRAISVLVLFMVVIAAFVPNPPAVQAINNDLSPEAIASCLGEGRRFSTIGELIGTYAPLVRATEPQIIDTAQVITVRTSLRLASFQAQQEQVELDRETVDHITRVPVLYLLIYAKSLEPRFAEAVDLTLVQGKTVIRPTRLINPPGPEMDITGGTLGFSKVIVALFPYGTFDPGATTEVIYTRDGRRITYEFDFARID